MNEARSKPDLVVMDAVACCLLPVASSRINWIMDIGDFAD